MFRLILAPKQLNWVSRAHARTNALANWVTTKRTPYWRISEHQHLNFSRKQSNALFSTWRHRISFLEQFLPSLQKARKSKHPPTRPWRKRVERTGRAAFWLVSMIQFFGSDQSLSIFAGQLFIGFLSKCRQIKKAYLCLSFDFTWCRLGLFFLPEYVLYICDFLSLIMRNMWGITSKN